VRRTLILNFLLCVSCSRAGIAQSIPATRPPSSQVALPGPQKHGPPSQPAPFPGTVEGFVYWDTASISHTPASSCSGLSVTVAVGNSSGGKSTAYQSLATLSNNFKYVGQVKQFVAGGKIKVYEVCTYGYAHVPVGPDLRVSVIADTASLSQPAPFAPMSVPQKDPVGPITVINGQCNMLPRIVNPTASDLFSHWGSCQNMAYDVNFMMQPANQALSSHPVGVSSRAPAQTGILNNTPQPGMLATGSRASGLLQSTAGTPQPSRQPDSSSITDGTHQPYTGATRQSGTVNGPGRNDSASLNPQPLPPHQALTNTDVIKMVKARTPESVIVHTIQSSSKQFDFSPEGWQALQQAHVSPAVLAAMCDGSARSCPEISGSGGVKGSGSTDQNRRSITDITNRGTSSSAPAGSNTRRGASVPDKLKPIKLALPTALEKVTNPRLSQQNASIIAVLEQQRQAAQQESLALKRSITTASAPSARTTALSANFRGTVSSSGVAPSQTQSAQGNNVSSVATLPFFNSLPITCTNDPTPRVLHVSGGQALTIFTPEAKYNQYTILGCSFGPSQPGNSAYIFGPNAFRANLNIDFWSDNGITAHFDPWLAGVLDQNNIALVISPAGKQPIQKQGFTFYAARGLPNPDGTDQDVTLPYDSMARPSVATFDVNNLFDGFDQLPSNAASTFPSFSYNGTPVAGWVFRFLYGHTDRIAALRAHDCFINDVGFDGKACTRTDFQSLPRNDTWDFNKMAPGFAISGYSLYYENIDASTLCGGGISNFSDSSLIGRWDFTLNQHNQIVVTWPVYDCFFSEFGTRDSYADFSSYGLAVWVLGPRCAAPGQDRRIRTA
jgi:hypothetical protein